MSSRTSIIKSNQQSLFSDNVFDGKIKLFLAGNYNPYHNSGVKYIDENGNLYFYIQSYIPNVKRDKENPGVMFGSIDGDLIYFDENDSDGIPKEVYVDTTFNKERAIQKTVNYSSSSVLDYLSTDLPIMREIHIPDRSFIAKQNYKEVVNSNDIFDYFKTVAKKRGDDSVYAKIKLSYSDKPLTAQIDSNSLRPAVLLNGKQILISDESIDFVAFYFKVGLLKSVTSSCKSIKSSNQTVVRQGPNLKTLNETPAEHIMKNLDAYKGYTRYDMEQLVLNPSGYTLYDTSNNGRDLVYKKHGATKDDDSIVLYFRNGELKNAEIKSSRKPIKSGINDTLIGESDNGEYSLYLSDCKYANHGKDPHQEYMLAHNGQVTDTVRTDDPYATSVKEHWQDVFHIKGVKSSRKAIKSSQDKSVWEYIKDSDTYLTENDVKDFTAKMDSQLRNDNYINVIHIFSPDGNYLDTYDYDDSDLIYKTIEHYIKYPYQYEDDTVISSRKPIKSSKSVCVGFNTENGTLLWKRDDLYTLDGSSIRQTKREDIVDKWIEKYNLNTTDTERLDKYTQEGIGQIPWGLPLVEDKDQTNYNKKLASILPPHNVNSSYGNNPLPTERDYRDFVDKLNNYCKNMKFSYGPMYEFEYEPEEGMSNDGWGHEYPNFTIYDTQGNLDMFSDDRIVKYIRNELKKKGWYPEAVHSSSDFTIAVE